MELITVYRTFNPTEAQLVRGRLEAAGIPATIRNEASALSSSAGIAGVELCIDVQEALAGEARELIDASEHAE